MVTRTGRGETVPKRFSGPGTPTYLGECTLYPWGPELGWNGFQEVEQLVNQNLLERPVVPGPLTLSLSLRMTHTKTPLIYFVDTSQVKDLRPPTGVYSLSEVKFGVEMVLGKHN